MTRVAWPLLAKRPRRGDLSQRTTRHRLYDDSYAVNSANSGPYGDAINYELIPAIERRFRGIVEGWARFTAAPPAAGKRWPCGCSIRISSMARVLPEGPHGRFGEGPLQVRVADLRTPVAPDLAGGLFVTLDQPGIPGQLLGPGESRDVVDLIESSAAQRSASQYQVNVHSTATTSSSRYGVIAWRNASGVARRLRSSRTSPGWSRMQRYMERAWRSMPE